MKQIQTLLNNKRFIQKLVPLMKTQMKPLMSIPDFLKESIEIAYTSPFTVCTSYDLVEVFGGSENAYIDNKNDTVYLSKNVIFTDHTGISTPDKHTILISGDISFSLNGFTLKLHTPEKFGGGNASLLCVTSGAMLRLRDSRYKTGSIEIESDDSNNSPSAVYIQDGGTAMIQSGNYQSCSKCYMFDNAGFLKIQGGTLAGPGAAGECRGYSDSPICLRSGSSLEIVGGVIRSGDGVAAAPAISAGPGTRIIISGGELIGGDGISGGNALSINGAESVTITGGIFRGGRGDTAKTGTADALYVSRGIADISGGTFYAGKNGCSIETSSVKISALLDDFPNRSFNDSSANNLDTNRTFLMESPVYIGVKSELAICEMIVDDCTLFPLFHKDVTAYSAVTDKDTVFITAALSNPDTTVMTIRNGSGEIIKELESSVRCEQPLNTGENIIYIVTTAKSSEGGLRETVTYTLQFMKGDFAAEAVMDGKLTGFLTFKDAWSESVKSAGPVMMKLLEHVNRKNHFLDNTMEPILLDTGAVIVIDLNGYNIDRELQGYPTDGYANGCVIKILDGELTIQDNSASGIPGRDYRSGKVTGGYDHDFGGILLEDGKFTLAGGSIAGNKGYNGGGVSIIGGKFEMSGGMISDNQADMGGGMFILSGDIIFSGGVITNNIGVDYSEYAAEYKNWPFGCGVFSYGIACIQIHKQKEIDGTFSCDFQIYGNQIPWKDKMMEDNLLELKIHIAEGMIFKDSPEIILESPLIVAEPLQENVKLGIKKFQVAVYREENRPIVDPLYIPGVIGEADKRYNDGKLTEADLCHFISDNPDFVLQIDSAGKAVLVSSNGRNGNG